jgi:hypothetical protein
MYELPIDNGFWQDKDLWCTRETFGRVRQIHYAKEGQHEIRYEGGLLATDAHMLRH